MGKFRVGLALSLAWGIICLPMSAAPAAIVTPLAGAVTLNGHAVNSGEAAGVGDRIQTGLHAGARLVLPGSAVYAGAGSRFRLEAGALHLNSGSLRVAGRMQVKAASETIAAAAATGIFTITRLPGILTVRSNRGSIAIRGAVNYTVPAGGTVRMQTTTSAAATGGGGEVSKGRAVAIAVVASAITGVVTGIIVHKATECNGCIVSPSS